MQVAGHGEMYKAYKYHNVGHALKTIIRTEGLRALYRGSLASFFKIPASMGLSYGLYDAVIRLVAADGIRMCAPGFCLDVMPGVSGCLGFQFD
jgi:Mitochondrial carrier protein